MRAIVQRVSSAKVIVEGRPTGAIGPGLLIYLGVEQGDADEDLALLVDKVLHLRIFPDADGKMNLDLTQAGGAALVVSAFTLLGDARRGRRPSFAQAAEPDAARTMYESFCQALTAAGVHVATGTFRAMMEVHSVNDGPVCILLDSRRQF